MDLIEEKWEKIVLALKITLIYERDRALMKEWIIKSTLKRIFSGTESILKIIRDIILSDTWNIFPLIEIKERLNYIPENIDLNFENFDKFMEEREKLLLENLKIILNK